MERHFVLPLTIAAAVHVGLLFGIPGDLAKSSSGVEKPPVPEALIRVFEILPVMAPDPDDSVKTLGNPAAPPTLPDRLAPERPDAIPVEAPPISPVVPVVPTAPIGPIGVPDGRVDAIARNGPGVVGLVDLDSPPHARLQVAPIYPFEAKRESRTGEVLVEFTVDEQGAVISPHVMRSSDRVFEEATLRAVSRWRFEPGRRANQIVRFRMAVPVVFNLNEN